MSAPRARTHAQPDLLVAPNGYTAWNTPERRRYALANMRDVGRYGITIRAPRVRELARDIDYRIAELPSVRAMLDAQPFAALVVLQGDMIVWESYAPDFGPLQLQTIMSITKTTTTLIVGRLVEEGKLDVNAKVKTYIPEIGSGYAEATVQQVLDMNVVNDYSEDYTDPDATAFQHEIAFGWRLPEDGQHEPTLREFLLGIRSEDVTNHSGDMLYKSANTDLLAWIAERVSNRALRDSYVEIAAAAGFEHTLYCTTDREFVPLANGGFCLCARDLARYGMLLASGGAGVNGERVGSKAFIDAARTNPGTRRPDGTRYSNQLVTNGRWVGHGGYGGQWLAVDPEIGTVVAFFSTLETASATDPFFNVMRVAMGDEIVRCMSER